MIELQHLQKSYRNIIALKNVNLSISSGEIFGIIGKSGAGKSTLLRTLNLLERPDSGAMIIEGEDWTTLSPKALRLARHKTAMIFQHFNLVHAKTVFENIALAMQIQGHPHDTIQSKVNELLELVDLKEKAQAYPNELSGGQKQRVAIARALSTSPKILLCDEATSALDPETTDSILALLKEINQRFGITIVLITHEMDVIKNICHRLAVMDKGEIIEVKHLNQVFKDEKSIARNMLFNQLSPSLPSCLKQHLTAVPNHKPLVKICFDAGDATSPFISQTSRELHININILLANIDRVDGVTFGVLLVELEADKALLNAFLTRCKNHHLKVEVLGYVHEPMA